MENKLDDVDVADNTTLQSEVDTYLIETFKCEPDIDVKPNLLIFNDDYKIENEDIECIIEPNVSEFSMDWSQKKLLKLIEIYKSHPVIWNTKDENYYKKNKKLDAWIDISTRIGCSGEECRRKIISLQSSYRREKSREHKSKRAGNGIDSYKSRWFAYESFRFLKDRDKPKQIVNTGSVNVSSQQNDIEESVDIHTQDKDREFITSRPLKRKRKQNDSTALLANAVNILQHAAAKLNFNAEDNEVKSCCDFLSSKMLTYSTNTRQKIQHAIYNILIQADTGVLDSSTVIRRETLSSSSPTYSHNNSSRYLAEAQVLVPNRTSAQTESSTNTIPHLTSIHPSPCISSRKDVSSTESLHYYSTHAPSSAGTSQSQYSTTTIEDLNDNFPSEV